MTLLRAIELFTSKTGIPPTRVGREAIGDPGLVRGLRRGRQLRPATRARLVDYLRQGGVAL